MDIRTYLQNNILLFDGAMGTLLSERCPKARELPCEQLNICAPQEVLSIHQAYLDAGCKALKTNTFGANRVNLSPELCESVIREGWQLARKASKTAYLFADIGPVVTTDSKKTLEEYQFISDIFLELGARHFLFETNSSLEGLLETAAYIKQKKEEAFILVSFAALPDGFTRSGLHISELISLAAASPFVDAVGLNCVSSANHMARLAGELSISNKLASFMPNAGYPIVLGSRTYYDSDPEYFGEQMKKLAECGARILGGCCGTTPEHIRATASAIKNLKTVDAPEKPKRPQTKEASDPFWDALCSPDIFPFAVELDPPENADVHRFMKGVQNLKDFGASIITIADCPIARARMDSSLLACKIQREVGMDALPHMTCRDRNLNAIKALLLGLAAENVHNVLTVTGDPIPSAKRDEVKSVYNFHSRMLAKYISTLGEQTLETPFHIFGALNLNARNFHVQLRLAQEKEANGVCGFLTQPILTENAFENLKLARQTLNGKILGGIFPLVSHKNACFMNSEVAGVTVDETIISMYEGCNREQGEALAIKISAEIAKKIKPYIDGYYLITPFGRTELIGKIMNEIRK